MIVRKATVSNGHGIHCRPSAIIAREARAFSCAVTASNGGGDGVDIRNVLGLLALEAKCGDIVTVKAAGPGERKACLRAVELFETDFGFGDDPEPA